MGESISQTPFNPIIILKSGAIKNVPSPYIKSRSEHQTPLLVAAFPEAGKRRRPDQLSVSLTGSCSNGPAPPPLPCGLMPFSFW